MATIQLPPDFKEFLKLLNSNKVEYLVGGYAVNYYGYPRATADLDIWIAIDHDNARRLAGWGRQTDPFTFGVRTCSRPSNDSQPRASPSHQCPG